MKLMVLDPYRILSKKLIPKRNQHTTKKHAKLQSIEKVNPSTMTFVDSFTKLNDTVTGFEGN